jgi:hypothetical protein
MIHYMRRLMSGLGELAAIRGERFASIKSFMRRRG